MGFDWDDGNLLKNWEKHGVSASECEQIFFNHPLVTSPDVGHPKYEARFYSLGKSDAGKYLFIVFTVRNNLIRIISARYMNRKGRRINAMKKIPKFKTEAEEREFWANSDSSDNIDWSKARRVLLPNIKPSLRTISLRLPEIMLEELKLIANKRDVPYQSLIKMFLSERLSKELNA
ncbi:MAG TPA: hypothetical protein DCG53_09905 [Syntrophus sp. (in: bacteria)]|nr:hypothetical protein [Syntrophus sp. (in: bacteria)]